MKKGLLVIAALLSMSAFADGGKPSRKLASAKCTKQALKVTCRDGFDRVIKDGCVKCVLEIEPEQDCLKTPGTMECNVSAGFTQKSDEDGCFHCVK